VWRNLSRIREENDVRAKVSHRLWPYRQSCARSFQFGRASAPIAPQIVQTMRGPKEGTVTPSAKPLASSVARGDCTKPRRR
jgi:hypothetical protein